MTYMPANMQDFIASLTPSVAQPDLSFVDHIDGQVPVYDGDYLRRRLNIGKITEPDTEQITALQQEWANVWQQGAGVLVVKRLYPQRAVVDKMTAVIVQLLLQQDQRQHTSGDHFAEQGKNGRLWNSLEKAALAAPDAFIGYYANPLLAYLCHAWLGPRYQITAQANIVYPGGKAQQPHRDYHLGFFTQQDLGDVPLHVQVMSSMLTLQGGIAHSDMPIASGPTMLLRHSQRYPQGYGLYQNQDFRDYFAKHHVQIPMQVGDGVFFNPALMHGADENTTTDIERCANLLQISSPFGVPMETVNHQAVQLACYDHLQTMVQTQRLNQPSKEAILTAISDNYPFPANMDRDPPGRSLMPLCGHDILAQALTENWPKADFAKALEALNWRKASG